MIEANDAAATEAALAELPTDWTAIDWAPYLNDLNIGGRRIRYVDYGSGTPVLLIHGIGGSWRHWLENIAAIGAEHRVIALDLPGFGDSEPLLDTDELGANADALVGLMDALEIDAAAVVGHSLGGLVAWLLTGAHPRRVHQLVLVDAATITLPAWRTKGIVWSFAATNWLFSRPPVGRAVLRRPRLRRLALRGTVADPEALSPRLAATVLSSALSAPGFRHALRVGLRALPLVKPAEMISPTLLIWGTADTVFPLTAARRLAAAIPGAQLIEIAGAAHCPQLERPAEFNAALLAFLKQPR